MNRKFTFKSGLAEAVIIGCILASWSAPMHAAPAPANTPQKAAKPASETTEAANANQLPPDQTTEGTVTVEGHSMNFEAVAGTILVGSNDKQDADFGMPGHPEPKPSDSTATPTARMFYVAYFEKDQIPGERPITFLYNGGPGSSTVWLHMGAFGPKRVVTADDKYTPPAPYHLANNNVSLLDASDLVFIDAPGTGFSRVYGKDAGKAFWGVDQDANAFARFITRFLTKYQRWNSPKYLFGESYGTTRSAILAYILNSKDDINLNGVVLLSQILNFDDNADEPQYNPGVDLPYELVLPSFTATAYFHHKLPHPPAELAPLLKEVEHFALTDYAAALAQGSDLPDATRQAIAAKLHDYTGLPIAYLLKANLRVDTGEFNINLQGKDELTTGRLDTRFSGPTLDPLSEEAQYDPQSAAISSAYVSSFNSYVRSTLKFGEGMTYIPESDAVNEAWQLTHHPPGASQGGTGGDVNVMPDLALAMKLDPTMKVLMNAGYFDLATPFFAAMYEMNHLTLPPSLRSNIQMKFYQSGHMVYVHSAALKELHDNVAAFIRSTSNVAAK